MGFYEGWQFLRNRKQGNSYHYGKLVADPSVRPNGYLCYDKNDESYTVRFRVDMPIREQVLTVIHETLHASPEFIRYIEPTWKCTKEVEDEIDRLAQIIYDNQPLLVKRLGRAVEVALRHCEVNLRDTIVESEEALEKVRKRRQTD